MRRTSLFLAEQIEAGVLGREMRSGEVGAVAALTQ